MVCYKQPISRLLSKKSKYIFPLMNQSMVKVKPWKRYLCRITIGKTYRKYSMNTGVKWGQQQLTCIDANMSHASQTEGSYRTQSQHCHCTLDYDFVKEQIMLFKFFSRNKEVKWKLKMQLAILWKRWFYFRNKQGNNNKIQE